MAAPQPNIILIITDQQRYDTINALGFPYMDTPNMDRLVNEGVTFTNCFITAPSCAPSRASIFTGYFPHTTGILRNADRWTHSWVELLADAGDVTAIERIPVRLPIGPVRTPRESLDVVPILDGVEVLAVGLPG